MSCREPPSFDNTFWWVEVHAVNPAMNSTIFVEIAQWTGAHGCADVAHSADHQREAFDSSDDDDDLDTGCWQILGTDKGWRVVKVFGPVPTPPDEALARRVEIQLAKEK